MLRWADAENPRNRNRKAEKNLRREFSRFAKFRQFASPRANFGSRATEQMGGFVAEVRIFFKKKPLQTVCTCYLVTLGDVGVSLFQYSHYGVIKKLSSH